MSKKQSVLIPNPPTPTASTALMIGHALEGSPGWHMELQIHKVIERAMCAEFGLTRGEYVKAARFTAPAGFQSPAWSVTVGIPVGPWLFDKFPWLIPGVDRESSAQPER
jgi:hypothetical protein